MSNNISWDPPGTNNDGYQTPRGTRFKIGTRPDGSRYLWEIDADGKSRAYLVVPLCEGSEHETYAACTGHSAE